MKYCRDCGSEIPDDAVFCPSCGRSVQDGANQGNNTYYNGYNNPPYYEDKYSTLSIIGFVLSFFIAIGGLIVSIIALNEAKATGSVKSRNFAKAGIVISSVEIALYVLIIIISVIVTIVGLSMV